MAGEGAGAAARRRLYQRLSTRPQSGDTGNTRHHISSMPRQAKVYRAILEMIESTSSHSAVEGEIKRKPDSTDSQESGRGMTQHSSVASHTSVKRWLSHSELEVKFSVSSSSSRRVTIKKMQDRLGLS